jgi:hypothetical protein
MSVDSRHALQLAGRDRNGAPHLHFNAACSYVLVGIGVLLFVIEMVALRQRAGPGADHHDVGGRAVHRH